MTAEIGRYQQEFFSAAAALREVDGCAVSEATQNLFGYDSELDMPQLEAGFTYQQLAYAAATKLGKTMLAVNRRRHLPLQSIDFLRAAPFRNVLRLTTRPMLKSEPRRVDGTETRHGWQFATEAFRARKVTKVEMMEVLTWTGDNQKDDEKENAERASVAFMRFQFHEVDAGRVSPLELPEAEDPNAPIYLKHLMVLRAAREELRGKNARMAC